MRFGLRRGAQTWNPSEAKGLMFEPEVPFFL
jgi:hypothetical protein